MNRFEKALALINDIKLEPFDSNSGNCIQHALVARDFLRAVSFRAEVKSVAVYVEALQDDQLLHSVGCGPLSLTGRDPNPEKDGWNGHLVTVSEGYLIDPTFYQFRRKAWDWIPDIARVKLIPAGQRERFTFFGTKKGRPILAAVTGEHDNGYRFRALWMNTPTNTEWVRLPAARLDRRDFIVEEMVEAWKAHEKISDNHA